MRSAGQRLPAVDVTFDTDGDGIADWWETANGLDPRNPSDGTLDFDGDFLVNIDEFHAGTNPYASDTDGDGRNDLEEDSDGDGLGNGDEVYYGCDPGNPDTDDDGYEDGDEVSNLRPDLPGPDDFGVYRLVTSPIDSLVIVEPIVIRVRQLG